ncbi:MAG: hypothetical protein AAGC64_12865 [Bacteroidota bacterium]
MINRWLFIPLSIISLPNYGQISIKSHYLKTYHCHQNTGCNAYGDDIKQDLFIRYNDQTLFWTKSIYEDWKRSEIRKVSDNYIISLEDELYSFVDLKRGTIYYIDFFKDAYHTWGFGPDTVQVKNNVLMMMKLLKDHRTQKDVMKFLIDQIE